jgi:hypothetical protein
MVRPRPSQGGPRMFHGSADAPATAPSPSSKGGEAREIDFAHAGRMLGSFVSLG